MQAFYLDHAETPDSVDLFAKLKKLSAFSNDRRAFFIIRDAKRRWGSDLRLDGREVRKIPINMENSTETTITGTLMAVGVSVMVDMTFARIFSTITPMIHSMLVKGRPPR